jgi:phosphatidylinositol glycan class M
VWYAALIPVALTNVHLNKWDMSWALGVWVVALAVWLLNAYQLEFTSTGQVHAVWLASLAFMCVNAAIIHLLLHRHTTVCSSFSADKKSN